jgi:hypothetical protein
MQELLTLAEFLHTHGNLSRKDPALLAKLRKEPLLSACNKEQAELFTESPIIALKSGDVFPDETDSVCELVDCLSSSKHRTAQQSDNLTKLYLKTQDKAKVAVKVWQYLHELLQLLTKSLKDYGEGLGKQLSKRKTGLLHAFERNEVGQKVQRLFSMLALNFTHMNQKLSQIRLEMEEQMQGERSIERLHDLYKDRIQRLNDILTDSPSSSSQPSYLQEERTKLECDIAKGVAQMEDIAQRVHSWGIKIRKRYSKCAYILSRDHVRYASDIHALSTYIEPIKLNS